MASEAKYEIGRRYLHSKNRQPVTLRYIGTLPPSSTSTSQIWYGIEYDDSNKGKHSGTFQGHQVFQSKSATAGAFVKASPGVLLLGPTFIEAVEARYGTGSKGQPDTEVILGSSNNSIVVEAPNLDMVQKRLGNLERLREMGLDGEWMRGMGGDEESRKRMGERLKGLRTLNLSQNLISTWSEIAEIVCHLPGLQTLVLNESRLAPLKADISEGTKTRLSGAFAGIKELHLGNSSVSWAEVLSVQTGFPDLEALYLNDNLTISTLPNITGDTAVFQKLRSLSLDGCNVGTWEDVVRGLGDLPSLRDLNLSSLPVFSIPPPSPSSTSFPILDTLTLLDAAISSWKDIDALNQWTRNRLRNLRISIRDPDTELKDPGRMTGNSRIDRPILVAMLPGLSSLNSSVIIPAERRDSELFYVSYVSKHPFLDIHNTDRCDTLSKVYGEPIALPKPKPKPTDLKSKLFTIHIYPADSIPFDLSLLPSSPIPLLKKKIARELKVDWKGVRVWTMRGKEKVEELKEGNQVSDSPSTLLTAQLLFLEAEDPSKPIKLYINSPGGSVTAGLAIYDTMQYISSPVHTFCMGQAASMGSLLLSGGEKGHRFALKNSSVMIHQPSGGASGQASDIALHAKEILRIRASLTDIYATHCRREGEETNSARDRFEKALERDYFMTAEEAVDFGIIDKIVEKRSKTDKAEA
ncbi:tubulin-specific chaperone E, partial [Tremellales sp. Uapishka_1]